MTRELTLGFIGLGQATNKLLERKYEIETLPYRITAAADPRGHALDAFRKEFGGETFEDAAELCERSSVDVVYIATPPQMHRAHAEMAARNGKHMVVEKPLALSLEDCEAMIEVADRYGVKMLAGHTHSFDAPVRKMREIITSGDYGDLTMVHTWNYNEFNHRARLSSELETTRGPIFNQGPHQVDVIRQIGGGMVKSVRANVIGDSLSGREGGYSCMLEFDNGVPATLVYDGRSFFDTAELFWWVSEGGQPRSPDLNWQRRQAYRRIKEQGGNAAEEALETAKEAGRFGAQGGTGTDEGAPPLHQPFFGLTVVSCDGCAMRQSQDGLILYADGPPKEILLGQELRGRAAELNELYQGIVEDRPIFHDGRWAMATLEVCFAIIDSAEQKREIQLTRQVPTND
jgi:phthalate 4,5-cis-dihydrodiol dehydrogenase